MKPHTLRLIPFASLLLVGLLLSACGSSTEETTPTDTVEQIQTEAVATFSAGLTSTAVAIPTATPTATGTPTLTATSAPAVTNTPSATVPVTVPPSSCEGLVFVADVTIPDNTTIDPGEEFTKTWKVRNSGTCVWEEDFELNFTGGEAMGGSSVTLGSAVQPGNEVDISVDLTGPTTAGTYRGNWRMTNAGGTSFGDEIFVLIVVGTAAETAAPTATTVSTATQTPTDSPTETATP